VVLLAVGGSLGLIPGVATGQPVSRHIDDKDIGGNVASGDSAPSVESAPAAESRALGLGDARGTGTSSPGHAPEGHPSSSAELPAESGRGRRVVYDVSAQRVWLVRDGGHVVRTYLVSGAEDPRKLPPGTYEVYSKSRHAISYDYEETMQYMVRFAHGERAAIGFHDIPRWPDGDLVQTRQQLGTPRSAGCIRQWRPDAKALWAFARVGTTVVVVP
jgi:lipoprotein-anchoring transpeptidase ErfK/SrfK